MPEGSDRKEGMPFYLGAFLAVALDWHAQAKNANLNTQALQALEARVAALEEERKLWDAKTSWVRRWSFRLTSTFGKSLSRFKYGPPGPGRSLRRASERLGGSMLWAG